VADSTGPNERKPAFERIQAAFQQIGDIAPLDLATVGEKPDAETVLEEESVEFERVKAELDSYKQDTQERKKYAHRIFCMISCWIGGIFLILLLEGFDGIPRSFFHLSDEVLLASIGSTTVNVLGIFYIVTHYLFPKR
jgi:hypothetical protein